MLTMKRKEIIYTLAASLVLGLGSCTSEDFWDTFDRTVDGPINFTVGSESASVQQASTRAGSSPLADGTKVNLLVEGYWNRKIDATQNPTGLVSKPATGYISGTSLIYDTDKTLFWDDFGTGDPENTDNRAKGLNVYGAAVIGAESAPSVDDWKVLAWNTVSDGKTEVKNSLLMKDIIISNNLKAYKFDNRNDADANKMEFIHPLSKITFNITAGVGFPKTGDDVVGATTYKFEKDPTLTFNNAITNGTIDIVSGTADASNSTTNDAIAGTTCTTDKEVTVIKQLLVYPGTSLGDSKNAVIAVLNADGNIYRITAEEIYNAIDGNASHKGSYLTKDGYNYIVKVIVNKTGIVTMATVTDWNKITADEAFPKINVTNIVGAGSNKPKEAFKFALWRSESINKDYVASAKPTANTDGSISFTGTNPLYWANHNQHLFLRGIYPDDRNLIIDADGNEAVEVENAAYDSDKFPSNFLMGMPEVGDKEMCGSTNHDQVYINEKGICAREAAINLNFRYMMSQVEVNLTSTTDNANAKVDLTNVTVELDNVGTVGKIMLSNCEPVVTTDNQTFTLPGTSSTHYHGIIIPQPLKNNSGNKVRFKITIYSDAEKTKVEDIYYADVAPIKVTENGKSTTTAAWNLGVHYVYNLNLTKTEIKATATLTNWKTVTASEEVWF